MLHIKTPYKRSLALSNSSGLNVYLKLENVQPGGSFKIRGIGHLCSKAAKQGVQKFVSSSGGNAGIAAAYAAQRLGVPIDIYTPESTPQFVVQLLRDYGAEVKVIGKAWDEANACAVKQATADGCVYVPPFDHPDIWEGNSSLIDEIKEDIESSGGVVGKPDLIICSCGGGGLLTGVVRGLKRQQWNDVPVLVMETEGASSLYQAVKAGKLVTLPAITSIAKSLGAKTVGKQTFESAKTHNVLPRLASDEDAVRAIERFLNEERFLVEPSCSVSLTPIYNGMLRRMMELGELSPDIKNVAVIVCGGSGINLDLLFKWKKQFSIE